MSDVTRYKMGPRGLEIHLAGSWISYSDYEALASRLDRCESGWFAADKLKELADKFEAKDAEIKSLASRLDTALALVREVLTGEAQPTDWNPRARQLLGVVERHEAK